MGVDQSPENYVSGICSKCQEQKRWNIWYHSDPTLCDDCYYVNGKYYKMTKEEIQEMKSSKDNVRKEKSDVSDEHKAALKAIIQEADEILDGFIEDSDVVRLREIAKQALYGESAKSEQHPKKYKFAVQEDSQLTLSPHEGFVYATSKKEAESEIREKYAERLGANVNGFGEDLLFFLFIIVAFIVFYSISPLESRNLKSQAITDFYEGNTIEEIVVNKEKTGWSHKVVFANESLGYVDVECDDDNECEVKEVDFKSNEGND